MRNVRDKRYSVVSFKNRNTERRSIETKLLCKICRRIKKFQAYVIKGYVSKKIVIRTLSLRKQRSSHRSSYHRYSIKKLFLKDLQHLRKTPVLESLFNKFAGLKTCNFIKKRLQQRCFPVNIAKFLRTPSLNNMCKWLVL